MINNVIVCGRDIDETFENWIILAKSNINENDSRDGEVVFECLNAITKIEDPTRCILKSKKRNLPMRYLIGELLWYLSGNNNLDAIRKYTNAWDRMSDDGKKVNSNYGYCMKYKFGFDQLEEVINELKNNPNSRRAVIHIKTADKESYNSKDVNCTCYLQFFIREGKLIMHTHMRSNDLWMGFPNDVFQFTCIQIWLAMKLNLELGEYVHIADSLHLYKRDYESLKANIEKIKGENKNV